MTKLISLTQGKFAIIDDEDYERVKDMKWCAHKDKNNWYAVRESQHKRIRLHRYILNAQSNEECDHIDGNGLNNQRSNLRLVSRSQNCMNRKKMLLTTSQYKGVYWKKSEKSWCAKIVRNGIRYHLGHFINEIDAAIAYDEAAIKFFGEYARLNFPKVNESV